MTTIRLIPSLHAQTPMTILLSSTPIINPLEDLTAHPTTNHPTTTMKTPLSKTTTCPHHPHTLPPTGITIPTRTTIATSLRSVDSVPAIANTIATPTRRVVSTTFELIIIIPHHHHIHQPSTPINSIYVDCYLLQQQNSDY